MKIWRTGTQYLVERDGSFCLVDAAGAVVRTYESSTWSVEDELGRTTYAVEHDHLLQKVTVERWHGETRYDDNVELDNLRLDEEPETQRYIATVLGDESVKHEEARIANETAAEARIAAIDGARESFALGADFARAQSTLVRRVYEYNDEIAASLLRTLIALARANVHSPALAMYVRGCLFASYVKESKPSEGEPVASPLAAEVAERASELDVIADHQEQIDAMQNARQYWKAAEAMRAAAKLLGA